MLQKTSANGHRHQWAGAVNRGFLNQQENEVLVHLLGMKKDVREQCTDDTHRVRGLFDPPNAVPLPNCCVLPYEVRRRPCPSGRQKTADVKSLAGRLLC